jgi:vacuolar-type H+-ATPase subunit H
MHEVIQQIIATESEAKAIVETARVEADRILSETRKKGQDIVEQVYRQTRVEAATIVEAAVETAEWEKKKRLTHAAAEIEKQIQLNQDSRQRAVEGVVRCVCGVQ